MHRKSVDFESINKVDMKYISNKNFQNEEEKCLYHELLNIYNRENDKVIRDADIIRRKIK